MGGPLLLSSTRGHLCGLGDLRGRTLSKCPLTPKRGVHGANLLLSQQHWKTSTSGMFHNPYTTKICIERHSHRLCRFVARAVFLAHPQQLNASDYDENHFPALRIKPNDPDLVEIMLNLFPLDDDPLLIPVSFVPEVQEESGVFWQQ